MTDKLKSELDAIFATHSKTKKKAEVEKSERESREEAFVQSFYTIQESIIRPTFEAIGDYVKGQGYEYRIDAKKEFSDREGRYEAPRVSIRFMLADRPGHYQDHDYPYFSVICEKASNKVRFHESTMSPGRGGQSGSVGDATLDGVTAQLLQEKLLNLIRAVFK